MAHSAAPPAFRPPSSQHSPTSVPRGPAAADSDDDDAPLPFPSALPRSDFLVPGFDPVTYLSSLPHRHQTLEDLRGELRDRSAAISSELLELVNSNYTAFLSLGNELRGGDDKVEDIKVSLMAFRRQVEDIKGKVRTRGDETATLNEELGTVRTEIETARKMMDLSERIATLEERLMLDSVGSKNNTGAHGDWSGGESEGDADDWDHDEYPAGFVGSSPAKLSSLARDYQRIRDLADEVGRELPFVAKMEERLMRCRNTIILDLNSALKEARKPGTRGGSRLVKYLATYRLLDAQSEAIKALKGN